MLVTHNEFETSKERARDGLTLEASLIWSQMWISGSHASLWMNDY